MNQKLFSFFAKCNPNLDFTIIFWHEPMFLISPNQTNLKDLFIDENLQQLDIILSQAFDNQKVVVTLDNLNLRNPKTAMTLKIMSTEKSLFVFGFDRQQLCKSVHEKPFNYLITQFMHIMRTASDEPSNDNQLLIRSQFEQVQKLNNELLNAQRQLKKLNVLLKQSNETLNNRLVKDHLTGLVSRYQYKDEINSMIHAHPDKYGVFAFIDIDDFKVVNDTYGHSVGDQYLIAFSQKLKSLPFENMICMRIAGDEFGIYIHPFDIDNNHVGIIWKEIQKLIKDPISIDTLDLPIYCSVGTAIYNKDTSNVFELIDFADFAMYQAKESGKYSFRQFNQEDYTKTKLEIYKKEYHGK